MSTEPSVLGGSAQPNANAQQLGGYEFSLPPLAIQKRIAEILGRLDDKIELNRRINATLEEMAQRLYKHWFVDFGPFQEGEFVESELGLIPQGWSVGMLGDVINFQNGKAIQSTEGKYPIYGANGIIGKTNDVKYKNGVIIGRVGAYCGAIRYCKYQFWASDNTIIAQPKNDDNFSIELIRYVLANMDLRQYAGGSAQPLLTQANLQTLLTVVPPTPLNLKFKRHIEPIMEYMISIEKESNHLATIRDYLLPRLLSGELSVEETPHVP